MKNNFQKTIYLLSLFFAIATCGCQQQTEKTSVSETMEPGEVSHTTPNREQLTEKESKSSNVSGPQNSVGTGPTENMVLISGGTFQMGSNRGMPHEAPTHAVTVKSFYMDKTEVTVAKFAKFVEATGYQTEAEKFGSSGVFDVKTQQWTMKTGANWRQPEGAGSEALPDEPVCQVSWNDAQAFAKWAGKRLPTEAEWEYAARGGLRNKEYAWGDPLKPNGKPVANWWQGEFPVENTLEDGFFGRAPVKSFEPNGYGLYDVAGNVWEWCGDWYAADYYENSPRENPLGAASGDERVMRGGSWMCAENFCTNYRVSGRSHSTPDTGLNNVGLRLARDAKDFNQN